MKISCHKCSKFLGEILSGSKLHKKIVFLCTECYDVYKTHDDLNNYKKNTGESNSMPEFMKDLMNGKIK